MAPRRSSQTRKLLWPAQSTAASSVKCPLPMTGAYEPQSAHTCKPNILPLPPLHALALHAARYKLQMHTTDHYGRALAPSPTPPSGALAGRRRQ